MSDSRPVVLLTGLGRRIGIAAGIAERLAADGWDIAFVYSSHYDDRANGGAGDIAEIEGRLRELGAEVVGIDADLGNVEVAASALDIAETLGRVTALVLSHAESVNSGILSTTVESFDRHFAVNARASWLLIREFAARFTGERGTGRVVALTSDAITDEVPYGASKGALDRIVFAAAREFAELGITSNAVNPGPVDTGWMTDEVRGWVRDRTPAGRGGQPADTASLVAFLLSEDGQWINGQLLKSDGGFSAPG
ncbi:SDR family oxidoreductase [Glaciihabitans sp. UYNi722]|uniref:SDR family oxidoreductase n=1 Tax=Glaciihabitans sp. UYNi722 TaxID=3156344 RepID=UPI003392E0D3